MATSIEPTLAKLREAINRLQMRMAAKGAFTLREGSTTTEVFDNQVGVSSHISVQATNAAAAIEYASGRMWIENGTRGFTVHHTSAATTRTFNYAVTV